MTADAVVHHGDCLDVLAGMPDASVDAIVTDPPYKLGQAYSANVDADNLLAVSGFWEVARELHRVTKPGGIAAIYYDTRILPLCIETMRRAGWTYLRGLTLYRRWGSASVVAGWMSTSDFILIYARPGAKHKFYGKTSHDVYTRTGPEAFSSGHPAQKPLEITRSIVQRVTPPGGTVLDPYAGSGTTVEAALLEGFRCVAIEREGDYLPLIETRIARAGLIPCHGHDDVDTDDGEDAA